MRLVLFLGAGFSAAAGLPVMKDFARHVRGLPGCDEDEHMCLRACINYAKATCAFIDGDIENFEHVMSVISLAAITSPDASLPTKHMRTTFARAIQVLQRLVWRVYQRLDPIEA